MDVPSANATEDATDKRKTCSSSADVRFFAVGSVRRDSVAGNAHSVDGHVEGLAYS